MIFAITNTKGGVGKTTTAVNIAAGFADKGRATLLVDLDPQANGTRCFMTDTPERTVGDLIMDKPSQAIRSVSPTSYSNLNIVPSTASLTETAELLSGRIRREERLSRALETLRETYWGIILDCPPSLGILTYNAIVAADMLIIPVQPGIGATNGIGSLIEAAKELRDEEKIPFRILITMYDVRNTRTNSLFAGLVRKYKRRFLKTIVYKSESLNQANLYARPIFHYLPSSRGAMDYDKLSDEILRLRIRSA